MGLELDTLPHPIEIVANKGLGLLLEEYSKQKE
jgi:hypothetical protein